VRRLDAGVVCGRGDGAVALGEADGRRGSVDPPRPGDTLRFMKRCARCRKIKSLEDFHRRGDGRQTWCKACRKAYDSQYHRTTAPIRIAQKRQRHEEMIAWYRSLKAGRPCTDCGGFFHHAAMAWDHLPGTDKVADVSSLLSRHSRRRVLDEIAKCELVCANCHAARTFHRARGVAQPG
jgi:hypothetical protein